MIKKIAFIVRSLPYKSEASRLALTHAIASQTVEIYLEDGDNVEPFLALVGDGVLNGLKNQSNKCYGITTLEQHITNALLLDLNVYYCKEDLDRLGISEDQLVMDAESLGGDMKASIVPFSEIQAAMEAADHLQIF
jgi:sulfur relay (sulfurtransferase) DsrF/TusC family protein